MMGIKANDLAYHAMLYTRHIKPRHAIVSIVALPFLKHVSHTIGCFIKLLLFFLINVLTH